MKRLTALAVVPVLAIGLAACGMDDDTAPSTSGTSTPSASATPSAPAAPPTPPTAADEMFVKAAYAAFRKALATHDLAEFRAIVHPRFASDLLDEETPKATLKAVADLVEARKILLPAKPDLVLVGGDAIADELRKRFPDSFGPEFDGAAAETMFTDAIGGPVDYVAYVVISKGDRTAEARDLVVGLARFEGAWKVVNLVT